MDKLQVPQQPGTPDRANELLPLQSLGASLLIGALVCVLGTLGFVWLAGQIFANHFVTIDDTIITRLHGFWGPISNQIMLFFTTMGESIVLGLFVGMAALALWRRGRWIDAAGLIVAAAGAGILNQALKEIFRRTRPDLFPGPIHLTSYSFPSGHAMGSIVCYGMLAFIGVRLLPRRSQRIALALAATILVLGIGLSRVYFGVHFPTDVLGGFVAGAIWLIISMQLTRLAELYATRRARSRAPSAADAPTRLR